MQGKPLVAGCISIIGWIGLVGAVLLAFSAWNNPPRGLPGWAAALAHLDQILVALLVIGAGEALAYLADIAAETERARRDAEKHAAQIAELLRAQAATPPALPGTPAQEQSPDAIPRDLLDRADYNGWSVWFAGEGRWRVARGEDRRDIESREALESFLAGLPARK
ncbi:MAG: hypothetical protein NBV67_00275 [Tagaea sp.]|nr:hypothetical protein [Tagaea sp.]